MASIQSYLLKTFLKIRGRQAEKFSVKQLRSVFARMSNKIQNTAGMRYERISAHGIPCEWAYPAQTTSKSIVFYLHGGGYIAAGNYAYRRLAARIAHTVGANLLHVDYRLAPEFPFPAAIDDAVTAYIWLQKQFPDHSIVMMGDSAGGGLALATTLKLQEDQIKLPASVVLLCPWLDLTCSGDSITSLAKKDPLLSQKMLTNYAQLYAQQSDKNNPYISPLFANPKDLPPILIQAGGHDILQDDAKRFTEKVRANEGQIQLDIWEGMIHVWHFFMGRVPESQKAIQAIADFVRQHE